MEWVIVILATVGVYSLVWYLNKSSRNKLAAKGRYVERGNAFFKQGHLFFTRIYDFSAIAWAIDKYALHEEKISFEPNVEHGQIVFRNMVSFGTFASRLQYLGQRNHDGMYAYRFQVEAWREGQYGVTRQDILGANVVLTMIERAILWLDPATEVQRAAGEYKTKLF